MSVGRDPASTVRLDVPGVSRRHARIVIDRQSASIEDLESKNGTTLREQMVTGPSPLHDGDRIQIGPILIVFQELRPETGWDLSTLSMKDRRTNALLQTNFNEISPAVSPNGEWIAYSSNESGRSEIYVRPFPRVSDGKWRVSTEGGTEPRWAPDGKELFCRSVDDTRMMAVAIATAPGFSSGKPRTLFEGQYFRTAGGSSYDISPDGQRFLMMKERALTDPRSSRPELVIILNWVEELKRKVPTH